MAALIAFYSRAGENYFGGAYRRVSAGNTEKAAQMIADAGIVPNAQIAVKALPNCNIVYMTGDEMTKTAKANFDVLFKADPKSVGGAVPADDFYYTGK